MGIYGAPTLSAILGGYMIGWAGTCMNYWVDEQGTEHKLNRLNVEAVKW